MLVGIIHTNATFISFKFFLKNYSLKDVSIKLDGVKSFQRCFERESIRGISAVTIRSRVPNYLSSC